ncbi:MAG: hypothetical protein FP825_02290 [Hyphomonas sp.]|uniref:hypothetical protein n=1 Tax=Hyphomonas sp. TaxID=87 RepID=UPI00182D2932|nr:hypothetical protein [Hyphomonas sp.]MBA3067294.1 hypothetical protein [Hyphomonas sp.]MBU3919004.1 hypothetical protein [Alphaproteobacteria bacterium]MBU4062982.1 hypothetical protein [Alphaproteobacteria bacterium]MBU4163563.1 hypothetical protein [Alphaproteobacteria bacterium]
MRRLLPALAALLLPACAAAAEPAPTPPPAAATPAPPCTGAAHHDFDFWLGDWEVFAANGARAGENAITRAEYGCLLVEHWTDAQGITGQSYNFVDPGTNKWRQLWVSGGAVIDLSGGLTETGAMRLEGTIAYQAGGPALPFRGEWTPNADGSVTQHFQQGDPATGDWSDWFTGTYVRKVAD